LRRAFLELGGTAYKDWKYQINYDFSHNSGTANDGYFDEASISCVGFKPVTIRAGRFDEDFGLETDKVTNNDGDDSGDALVAPVQYVFQARLKTETGSFSSVKAPFVLTSPRRGIFIPAAAEMGDTRRVCES